MRGAFLVAAAIVLASPSLATEAEMEALKICNLHHIVKAGQLSDVAHIPIMAWEPGFENCQALADKLNGEAAARKASRDATDAAKIKQLLGQ